MTKSNGAAPNSMATSQPEASLEEEAVSDEEEQHRTQGAHLSRDRISKLSQDDPDEEQLQELDRLDDLLKRESGALSPDEVQLRDELIEKHRGHLRQGIKRVEIAQFSGPLPPPNVLASYDQVLPGAAERILQLAEREQASRHRQNDRTQDYFDKELQTSANTQRIGQFAGSFIALACLGLAFYAFSIGESGLGVAIVLGEIVALTSAFVLGRRNAQQAPVEDTSAE